MRVRPRPQLARVRKGDSMASKQVQEKGELFKLDGKPSFGEAFPQAMQHVLAMLVGNITPSMLIAGTCGLSAAD